MPSKASSPAVHPPLGTLIDDDNLELVEVLGVGGYGVVYRAIDARSPYPKSYAVKCLTDPQQQSSRQRHLHIREITLHQLASVHPNVVTLHRVIEDFDHTYIIMDYASDGDLFTQILHNCRYLGDDSLIKHVFLELLDAVEYCHSLGIYHRDLKPENVLCFDGGLRVAITDFGLATTDKVSEEFRTGSVYHMSPECQGGLYAPTGTYSPMFNDIWSLAIILLNLATGRNPWKSASASDPTFQAYIQDPLHFLPTVLPISHELNSVLVRMLEVDWRDRMTLPELRKAMENVDSFYSDGAVFEGSMARCPWEAGMDIDSEESTKGESPPPESPKQVLKSHWSKDSGSSSDIVFASQSTEDEYSYGRWDEYSSCAATWGFESPASSAGSRPVFRNIDIWESPRTPPSTRSPISPSCSESIPSPPATPSNADDVFGDRVEIAPAKSLRVDTICCEGRYYNASMRSFSTESSIMQTAIDYDSYSSSFFLASPASQAKASLPKPSPGGLGRNNGNEDREMDGVSWDYPAEDMSYPSLYSGTHCSFVQEDIICDIKGASAPSPDTIIWPAFRAQPTFVSQSRQLQDAVSIHPEASDASPPPPPPRSSSKKSNEGKTRSKGSGIFKFAFSRSPRSSSLSPEEPLPHSSHPSESFQSRAFGRSRTPSPPPRQPWSTFSPTRAKTPAATFQEGECRRTARRTGLHWFSPGKLFAAAGAS